MGPLSPGPVGEVRPPPLEVPRPHGKELAGPPEERILLAVGPEGGWEPHEVELLAAKGFSPVGLGPRILRSDVAVNALISLAQAQLETWDRAKAKGGG